MFWTFFLIYYLIGVLLVARYQRKKKYRVDIQGLIPVIIFALAGPLFYFLGKKFDKQDEEERIELQKGELLRNQIDSMEQANANLYNFLARFGQEMKRLQAVAKGKNCKVIFNITVKNGVPSCNFSLVPEGNQK